MGSLLDQGMKFLFIGKTCRREQMPTRPIILPVCFHFRYLQVYNYSPLPHAPPPHQQAAAPTSSYKAPPTPSPASSHHIFPKSPASSGTPHTSAHPCALQSGKSP